MNKILLFLLFSLCCYHSYAQQCNVPLKIVVLGSSTAWGNGVPARDSAWTFRYLRYLKANHRTDDTVIILAKGGNSTHTIQATGTPAYTVSGVTFTVDTTCNISKALSLNPSAIIVNIPNEDEARSFPLSVQVANLLAIKQQAALQNVPLWVATTQPRNNLGYASGARLLQMKDSIINYFGTKAIDFMTGLADNRGYILPAYNSGDDALLNSSGQQVLFERVAAKQLPQALCGTTTPGFQLSAFTSAVSGQKIWLSWSTISEVNTLRFGVERSADSLNWTNIAYINAAGNSNGLRNYGYADSPLIANQFYFYRLNMETATGQHTFSPVIKNQVIYRPGIELTALSVSPQQQKLLVSWSTASETASLRFGIERSTDTINWSNIGYVNGAGNSNSSRNYTFTDSTVIANQLYYYRLNHETTTGLHTISQVVTGKVVTGTGNCSKALKVVVLGSSTAWGNGLPDRDSAWTLRYARYLKQYHNSADTLILKAIGSSTTQNMMPTGTPAYTVPATGLTYNVDTLNNITKAISFQPDFIIINMPSNDEARSFPLSKQVENFRVLKQVAADNNIPLWVTTSQPRSNLGYASAQRLMQLKDSINLLFGDKAIDFWTGLGYPNGYIDSLYNSGDDVHFNAAGQRILFERVVAKNIPSVLCGSTARHASPVEAAPTFKPLVAGFSNTPASTIKIYPNPATSYVNIPAFCQEPFLLEVYNSTGTRLLQEKRSGSVQLQISSWPAGIYYLILTHGRTRERLKFIKIGFTQRR